MPEGRPKLSTEGAATRMTLQHITDNLEELRADQVRPLESKTEIICICVERGRER